MTSLPINVKMILSALKIQIDPETAEYLAQLVFQYQEAPNKQLFFKEALRKALIK